MESSRIVFFGDWLISLSTMSSRFIHIVAYDRLSFLKAEWPTLVCIYHTWFIHSSVHGHLGCLHFLARLTSAAVTMGAQTSHVLLDKSPEMELPGSMVVLFLIFFRTTLLFSTPAVPFYIPTSSAQNSDFPHPRQHLLFSVCLFLW